MVARSEISLRGRAQRNFGVSSHHVLAGRRVLRFLCLHAGRTQADQQQKQHILISFHFHVNFPSEVTWISKYTLYCVPAAAEDTSSKFPPRIVRAVKDADTTM